MKLALHSHDLTHAGEDVLARAKAVAGRAASYVAKLILEQRRAHAHRVAMRELAKLDPAMLRDIGVAGDAHYRIRQMDREEARALLG